MWYSLFCQYAVVQPLECYDLTHACLPMEGTTCRLVNILPEMQVYSAQLPTVWLIINRNITVGIATCLHYPGLLGLFFQKIQKALLIWDARTTRCFPCSWHLVRTYRALTGSYHHIPCQAFKNSSAPKHSLFWTWANSRKQRVKWMISSFQIYMMNLIKSNKG